MSERPSYPTSAVQPAQESARGTGYETTPEAVLAEALAEYDGITVHAAADKAMFLMRKLRSAGMLRENRRARDHGCFS